MGQDRAAGVGTGHHVGRRGWDRIDRPAGVGWDRLVDGNQDGFTRKTRDRQTYRQRTETERERRQKDIQRQTDRDRGTEADRDKERERERQTDRQRPTDRDRKRSVPLREARSGSSGPITQPTKDPVDKEGQDTRP